MNYPSATRAPSLSDEDVPISEIVVPLVGVERHERALTLAHEYAVRWGAGVHIVHVRLENDPVDLRRLDTVREAFRARYPETDVRSTLVEGQSVPAEIAALVSSSSLIVMSSEHANRGGSASTAEDILRRTGGPALLIGSNADHEHVGGPVTVALDGSPTSEGAISCAVAFANSLGERLMLLQVVSPSTTQHVARLRSEGQRVSESGYLRSVADRLSEDGHRVDWEVIHETDVVRGLLAAAHQCGSGTIVIGTHGDTGLTRRMLGSTAMGLVAASSQPILVVKTGSQDQPELSA